MGLFDKKYCDICGDKIGLLGNRKLADGNMCKNCAKKLSPFCDDRRQSTIEEIKRHLQYREENKAVLRSFNPTMTYGEYKKIYVDMMNRTFVVSHRTPTTWAEENPDVIPMSQITSCVLDIDEDRDEIYTQGRDGQQVSYNPPRYNFYYNFELKFTLNNPYFDDFEVRLNNSQVEGMGSMEYHRYQQMAMDIMNALGVNGNMPMNNMGMNNMGVIPPHIQQNPQYSAMNMGQMQNNGYAQQNNPFGQQPNPYNQQGNQFVQQQNMYQQQANPYNQQYNGYQQNNGFNQQSMQSPAMTWMCPNCNATNSGVFCECCGTRKV